MALFRLRLIDLTLFLIHLYPPLSIRSLLCPFAASSVHSQPPLSIRSLLCPFAASPVHLQPCVYLQPPPSIRSLLRLFAVLSVHPGMQEVGCARGPREEANSTMAGSRICDRKPDLREKTDLREDGSARRRVCERKIRSSRGSWSARSWCARGSWSRGTGNFSRD